MVIGPDCRKLLANVVANNARSVRMLLTTKELHPTAPALGLAMRYMGPEMTGLLLDLGASLTDDVTEEYAGYPIKVASDLEFIEYLSPQFSLQPPIEGLKILPDAQRIACAQVLLNRQAADPSQMLFYAILYDDDPIREFLESEGVTLEGTYMDLLEGNADIGREDVKHHVEALRAVFKNSSDEQIQDAVLRFEPYLHGSKFPMMRYDLLSIQRICEPQFISFVLSDTDFLQESCNWSAVRHFLDIESVSGLDYALTHDWTTPEEREYLLEIAHTDPTMSPEIKALILNGVKPEGEGRLETSLGLESDKLSAVEADKSWTYDLQKDGTYKITGYKGAAREVIIPAHIDGKPVTAIDADTFDSYAPKSSEAIAWRRRSVVWIQFPGTISIVPRELFADYSTSEKCPNLREVVLCDGVEVIDDCAFRGCKALRRVDLPPSLHTIGAYAFARTGLTEIELPAAIDCIGFHAFEDCVDMRAIHVKPAPMDAEKPPHKAEGRQDWVFEEWGTFGDAAFQGCTSLHEACLPSTIRTIGAWAFFACAALQHVILPRELNQLGYGAFRDCRALRSCDLPPKLEKIGMEAFAGSGLEHVAIPASVHRIGVGVFENCIHLRSAEVDGKTESIPDDLFRGCRVLQTVTLPASALTIGAHAFADCGQLSSLRLSPDTRADMTAFEDCKKLANADGCIIVGDTIRGFTSLYAARKAELNPTHVSKVCGARGLPDNWYPLVAATSTPDTIEAAIGATELPTDVYELRRGQTIVLGRFPAFTTCEPVPLVWRVLAVERDRALLLTDQAILQRTDALDTDPQWAPGPLRSFLNDAFLSFAFSEPQRERILQSGLINDCKPTQFRDFDEPTTDHILIPAEISGPKRRNACTEYVESIA